MEINCTCKEFYLFVNNLFEKKELFLKSEYISASDEQKYRMIFLSGPPLKVFQTAHLLPKYATQIYGLLADFFLAIWLLKLGYMADDY